MKRFFSLILFLVSFNTSACVLGQYMMWQPSGYNCVQNNPLPYENCVMCQQTMIPQAINPVWFNQFPPAIFQPQPAPWWATQGNFYYPNMNYPGAWNHTSNTLNHHYYPGTGEVFAGKPNVYVESIHKDKKFTFSFNPKAGEELSFLATTPMLDVKNSWKGKIVNNDQFEVEDVNYDYLFYDIRLAKDKMQFERGTCASREDTLKWMLEDLKIMNYPSIALQDFEQHWKVKLPPYPFFCIYPQYNQQLDEILPVTISVEQVRFTRSLYVLVSHEKFPDLDDPQKVPLPSMDPAEFRPSGLIKYETMFKEWGVAFFGQ